MLSYKIRIDTHNKSVIDKVIKDIDRYIVSFEGGPDTQTKAHVHMYVETTVSHRTLRARITKQKDNITTEENKKGWYSCVELLPEKDNDLYLSYTSYIVKDNKYITSGITDHELGLMVAHDLDTKKKYKEKKSRKTVYQELEEYVSKEYNDEHPSSNVRKLISEVVEFYRVNDKLIREFAMVSQIQTLALKYIPHYYLELEERLHSKVLTSVM